MTRKALLVLDPQRDFFRPGNPNAVEFGTALTVINQAIGSFRAAGLPVVFLLHTSATKPVGSWEHGIWDDFDANPTDLVINKGFADAFWESELDERLRDLKVGRTVLAGFLSDVCVLGTYFGAMVRGYHPQILANGTAAIRAGARSAVETIANTIDTDGVVGAIR